MTSSARARGAACARAPAGAAARRRRPDAAPACRTARAGRRGRCRAKRPTPKPRMRAAQRLRRDRRLGHRRRHEHAEVAGGGGLEDLQVAEALLQDQVVRGLLGRRRSSCRISASDRVDGRLDLVASCAPCASRRRSRRRPARRPPPAPGPRSSRRWRRRCPSGPLVASDSAPARSAPRSRWSAAPAPRGSCRRAPSSCGLLMMASTELSSSDRALGSVYVWPVSGLATSSCCS